MAFNPIILIILAVFLVLIVVFIYYKYLSPTNRTRNPPVIVLAANNQKELVESETENLNKMLNTVNTTKTCSNDLQCPWGQVCQNNTCTLRECNSDSSCAPGQKCKNKVCVNRKCKSQKDCGKGETCIRVNLFDEFDRKGFCQPTGKNCSSNLDCHAGTPFCVSGNCVSCNADSDCLLGEVCSNAGTGNAFCRGKCKHDTDCIGSSNGNAKHCIKEVKHCCPNTGNFGMSCTNNSECGANGYCSQKTKVCTCVPQKGKQLGQKCSEARDCDSKNCMTDARGNKVCGYPGGKCVTDSHCGGDKPFCVTGVCKRDPTGSTCQSTAKCRSTGLEAFCVDNLCRLTPAENTENCTSTSDCRTPLICVQNTNGINICAPQKQTNQMMNVNTRNGYIPPPDQPKTVRKHRH